MNAARRASEKGWKHHGVSMNADRENGNLPELFHLLRRKDEGSVPSFCETMEKALSKQKGCVMRQAELSFLLHPISFFLPPSRRFRTLVFASGIVLISVAMTLFFRIEESPRTEALNTFFNWRSPTLSLLRTTEYEISQMDSFVYRRFSLNDWRSPTASLLMVKPWEPADETITTNHNS